MSRAAAGDVLADLLRRLADLDARETGVGRRLLTAPPPAGLSSASTSPTSKGMTRGESEFSSGILTKRAQIRITVGSGSVRKGAFDSGPALRSSGALVARSSGTEGRRMMGRPRKGRDWRRQVTVREASLYVDVVGHGDPLVLMHGGPSRICGRWARSGGAVTSSHWCFLP